MIYLDTCLLIYLTEKHPRWHASIVEAMAGSGEARFGISPLVKSECLVGPLKRGDPVLEQIYRELFERFVSLSMSEAVFLQAAQLRARFALKTPDALHLSCAQHHRCDALWTNDDRLSRVSHGMARNVLTMSRTG